MEQITIRPVWRFGAWPNAAISKGIRYPAEKVWRIHGASTDLYVVQCKPGMTIVDPWGQMLYQWQVGMSPGDFARLYVAHCDA